LGWSRSGGSSDRARMDAASQFVAGAICRGPVLYCERLQVIQRTKMFGRRFIRLFCFRSYKLLHCAGRWHTTRMDYYNNGEGVYRQNGPMARFGIWRRAGPAACKLLCDETNGFIAVSRRWCRDGRTFSMFTPADGRKTVEEMSFLDCDSITCWRRLNYWPLTST
jgi:hypothetical protein